MEHLRCRGEEWGSPVATQLVAEPGPLPIGKGSDLAKPRAIWARHTALEYPVAFASESKRTESQNHLKKKRRKTWRTHTSCFQNLLKYYGNEDGTVPAEGQLDWSTEDNENPGVNPHVYGQLIFLLGCQDNKTRCPRAKKKKKWSCTPTSHICKHILQMDPTPKYEG